MDSEPDKNTDSSDISQDYNNSQQQDVPDNIEFTKKEKKQIQKGYRPQRILIAPAKKVDTIYYDDKNRPVAYTSWRKVKPFSEVVKLLAKKPPKNPDKKLLGSIGKFPYKGSVWTFKNNDTYIYVGKGVDYLQFEAEEFYQLILQALGITQEDDMLIQKLLNADFVLQHISHSKLPHFKVKDWTPQTVELNLDKVTQESEKRFEDKRKSWK